MILWSVWGFLVAGLVLLMDENPWFAAPWLLCGIITGLFGFKALGRFADPLLEWYRSRNPNDAALQRRLFELSMENETDSDEYLRCMEEEHFWMSLPLAPLFGLFHGVLFGTILGALGGSGAVGALVGLFLGPLVIAFLAALTLACIVDVGTNLCWWTRLCRRLLLVGSPLLMILAGWHRLLMILRNKRSRHS